MPFFHLPTLALVLERPAGLALLALPILLWLFLRRREEPRVEATGLFTIWRELAAGDARSSEGGARRLTLRAWWLVAALSFGALSVSGPGAEQPPQLETYELIVDRSPSMYLPLSSAGGRRRYDAAVEAAVAWLDGAGVPGASRRWTTAGAEGARGQGPPESWSEPPAFAAPELRAAVPSSSTCVTDRRGEHPGGQFVSGGMAIPGWVGEASGRAIRWDGASLVEGQTLAPRRVAVDGALAPRLERLVEFWCAERGHARVDSSDSRVELRLRVPIGTARAVEASGIDWSLAGSAVALAEVPERTGSEPWLTDSGGEALVHSGPSGTIHVGLVELGTLGGDPAAFAVAWGELLDRSLPPRRGIVPLAERVDAGGPSRVEPRPVTAGAPGAQGGPPLAAWLALVALVAGAVAFRPSGAPRSVPPGAL